MTGRSPNLRVASSSVAPTGSTPSDIETLPPAEIGDVESAVLACVDQMAPAKVDERGAILETLPIAVIAVDALDNVTDANAAAEVLLGQSRALLKGMPLRDVIAADNPLFGLIAASRSQQISVTEYDLAIGGPRLEATHMAVEIAPVTERPGHVVIAMINRRIERRISQQQMGRDATRSVRAMAGMLAHEVKNPLSGIRGAAQLLEAKLVGADLQLAELIREETDRIVALINRMEMFTDDRALRLEAVNIHEVLDRVRRLAQHGVGATVEFQMRYDPSLPPVGGNRDMLIQAFFNLVRNAAEACPTEGGMITLSTSYHTGLRMGERSRTWRHKRCVCVAVEDNGSGVPAHLQASLFDPFVSEKPGGKGLGLALVAKIVQDHGGMIEFTSELGHTQFTVLLPLHEADTEKLSSGALP
jgi:two-component system nitrogen regulation sensor histidine kinase GlnL